MTAVGDHSRPGLYILVICCLLNTCGGNQQRIAIQEELEITKTNLNYAIHLLEGGEPRVATELDCSRSTEEIIDCRPVE